MRHLLAVLVTMILAPAVCWADAVGINTADAATIARELKGIGPAKADAIVQYRQQHGAFKSIDELALVKGIGPKVLELNRANIRIDSPRKPGSASPAVPNAGKAVPAGPAPRNNR